VINYRIASYHFTMFPTVICKQSPHSNRKCKFWGYLQHKCGSDIGLMEIVGTARNIIMQDILLTYTFALYVQAQA
jgi:hypothetical protein